MRFLSNTYDPRKPNAQLYLTYSLHAQDCGPEAMEQEWQHHLEWIDSNQIHRPKATDRWTVEELEAQDMVGIYSR